MRIAILSDPENFHTQKWYTALRNAGADPFVVSFGKEMQEPIRSIHIDPPLSFGKRFFYPSYLAGGKKLRALLEKEKCDILNPLNITPFGIWGARADFHPMVSCAFGADILEYPPRGIESPWPENRSWNNTEGQLSGTRRIRGKLERNFFRKKVMEALKASDLITGDNLVLTRAIHEWFGIEEKKIVLNRWGVEEELFSCTEEEKKELLPRFGISPEKKIVLAPRGAKAIYQADIILEAFAEFLKTGRSDVHFVLFSAGYEISSGIKPLIEQLNRSGCFTFIPTALPRETMYKFWNLADVFISAPVYDGYSASLAEGRYIGAVPLVNKIPANTELITHLENGWIADPFTPENISSSLVQILDDLPNLKSRFSAANRNWIKENSLIRNNAKIFVQNCESLLKDKKGKSITL